MPMRAAPYRFQRRLSSGRFEKNERPTLSPSRAPRHFFGCCRSKDWRGGGGRPVRDERRRKLRPSPPPPFQARRQVSARSDTFLARSGISLLPFYFLAQVATSGSSLAGAVAIASLVLTAAFVIMDIAFRALRFRRGSWRCRGWSSPSGRSTHSAASEVDGAGPSRFWPSRLSECWPSRMPPIGWPEESRHLPRRNAPSRSPIGISRLRTERLPSSSMTAGHCLLIRACRQPAEAGSVIFSPWPDSLSASPRP